MVPMSKLLSIIRGEPAIVSAVLALATQIVLAVTDAIELGGGELLAIIAATLGAGAATRQQVTPTG